MNNFGDPHINTIDNGRYTCHIQGIYIYAQTTTNASIVANNNLNNDNVSGDNFLYPTDLFKIYVRSVSIPPALYFIERTQGLASVFSSYTLITGNFTFNISNENGKFGKTIFFFIINRRKNTIRAMFFFKA